MSWLRSRPDQVAMSRCRLEGKPIGRHVGGNRGGASIFLTVDRRGSRWAETERVAEGRPRLTGRRLWPGSTVLYSASRLVSNPQAPTHLARVVERDRVQAARARRRGACMSPTFMSGRGSYRAIPCGG